MPNSILNIYLTFRKISSKSTTEPQLKARGGTHPYMWYIGMIAPSWWVESSKSSFALGQNGSKIYFFFNLKGKDSIFSPNYEMFFENLTKYHYFQALISGMQRFIGQNGILQGGSFSNFRGDHTYQIFEEVAF